MFLLLCFFRLAIAGFRDRDFATATVGLSDRRQGMAFKQGFAVELRDNLFTLFFRHRSHDPQHHKQRHHRQRKVGERHLPRAAMKRIVAFARRAFDDGGMFFSASAAHQDSPVIWFTQPSSVAKVGLESSGSILRPASTASSVGLPAT
ncbi:hypothetical protein D3C87_1744470 [compost metagenome]